jgi:hypothetical protein
MRNRHWSGTREHYSFHSFSEHPANFNLTHTHTFSLCSDVRAVLTVATAGLAHGVSYRDTRWLSYIVPLDKHVFTY